MTKARDLANIIGTGGNLTITGTVDGRDVAADGTKLDGIEAGATADQTAAEILTAIKTVDGAGSGLDADLLDGQNGAYYTGYADTAVANLVAAAPTTLDTLNELAAALGNDPNFATTVSASTGTKLDASSYTAADVLSKIITVDGAGSGLDADTVDGIQATSFLRSDATDTATGEITFSNSSGITIGEAQLYHETDLAWKGLTIKNLGDADEAHLGGRSSDGTQRFMIYADSGSQGFLNPANNAWKLKIPTSGSFLRDNAYTIWDSGNDGSGSGLDADLLDGIDSSAFVRNNNGAQSIAGSLTLSNGSVLYTQKAASATTGGTAGVEIKNGGGTGDSNLAAVAFHCEGTYATHFHLRNDGYLGAGGWSASSWRWYVYMPNGDMTASGNVTAYSDERLKDNVAPLENALDKVLSLDGVSFTWKNLPEIVGRAGQNDLGILAQQVEAVAPEAVSASPHISDDGDPYKTVAYDKLVPLLIEAIKEQQAQIDALKATLGV